MFRLFFALLISTSPLIGEVYDCFLYLNEWEVLEIRLNTLDPYVDYFVVVEAVETFKGHEKPLYFQKVQEKFAPYSNKIKYFLIEERFPTSNPWERETFQRNQIMRALEGCQDGDLILISDVDEIVRPEKIPAIFECIQSGVDAVACEQPFYRYFLNRYDPLPWTGTVVTTFGFLKARSPQHLRGYRESYPVMPDAGWHFTSMGGYDRIVEKVRSFSHTEEECKTPNREEFMNLVRQYPLVPIDETFPEFVRSHQDYLEKISLIDTSESIH